MEISIRPPLKFWYLWIIFYFYLQMRFLLPYGKKISTFILMLHFHKNAMTKSTFKYTLNYATKTHLKKKFMWKISNLSYLQVIPSDCNAGTRLFYIEPMRFLTVLINILCQYIVLILRTPYLQIGVQCNKAIATKFFIDFLFSL